ncbi:hypothetical protein AB0878_44950 [Amycolatopsis sp. NPDC047767]|uniref:hypothetical protein n=1 Tax=Amycolatopsis sp. NPDC047767 TaxID=3156765 RepID=UPI003452F619
MDDALVPFAEALAAIESAQSHAAAQEAKARERLADRIGELDAARAAAEAEGVKAREDAGAALADEVRRWRMVMGGSVRAMKSAGLDANAVAAVLGVSVREVNTLARVESADARPDVPEAKAGTGGVGVVDEAAVSGVPARDERDGGSSRHVGGSREAPEAVHGGGS